MSSVSILQTLNRRRHLCYCLPVIVIITTAAVIIIVVVVVVIVVDGILPNKNHRQPCCVVFPLNFRSYESEYEKILAVFFLIKCIKSMLRRIQTVEKFFVFSFGRRWKHKKITFLVLICLTMKWTIHFKIFLFELPGPTKRKNTLTTFIFCQKNDSVVVWDETNENRYWQISEMLLVFLLFFFVCTFSLRVWFEEREHL